MQDERFFLVSHFHSFGCAQGQRLGLRHHHRHSFADVARLVGRQQRVGTDEHGAAAGAGQLRIEFGLRHRIVRDRRKLVGGAVGAGEHAEHAWHRLRLCGVDRDNARVRIRRTHHHRVGFSVEIEIVGESTCRSTSAARVFLARQRLASMKRCRPVSSGLGFVVHLGSLAVALPGPFLATSADVRRLARGIRSMQAIGHLAPCRAPGLKFLGLWGNLRRNAGS